MPKRVTTVRKLRNSAPKPKDYMPRLKQYQPQPMSTAMAKSLHDENRGER